jgi:hypothetical protein
VKLFPLSHLEGDDLLLHEVDPILALAGKAAVFAKLEEHGHPPWVSPAAR